MYKHVIWDFDGTLFDAYPPMVEAMFLALSEIGIDENRNDILKLMKVSMGDLEKYLKNEYSVDRGFFGLFDEFRFEIEENMLAPFEGVVEMCRYIKNMGGDNHLFTHRGESAIHFLDKFGMLDDFTELITSERGFKRKPSPEGIEYIIEKYSYKIDETIMIGDRDIDLLSAKNAGVKTCFFRQEGDIVPDSADYVIDSFKELAGVLNQTLQS